MEYYLPVIIVVVANATYDMCSKAIPEKLNQFAGLTITYLCLAIMTLALFFIFFPQESLLPNIKGINWAIVVYGLSSIGIETGYILLFRAGWNISLGALVCNMLLAVFMVIIGLVLFKESLSIAQFIGIALCLLGLVFINRADIQENKEQEEEQQVQQQEE